MRRLRSLLVVVLGSLLFAAAGYGAALVLAPPRGDSGPPPEAAPVTAEVERRRLDSTLVVRGDAAFASPEELVVRVGVELPVVTGTPLRVGDSVASGDVVVEVAGRPVIALPGRLPPYRDLHVGDVGPDVAQLEVALAALGLDVGTVDDELTEATARAVADLYDRVDHTPPAEVDAAPGAAEAAPDPADDGAVEGAADGPPAVVLPMSEVTFATSLPRRVDRAPARVGGPLPEQTFLLSDSDLVVSVDLTAADADLLRAGMRARVTVPGGRALRGRLGPVRRTGTGARTTVRLPTLSPGRTRAVRGANVKVSVPLGSSGGPVLVVPLAALSTDAAGTVRVVRVDDGDTEAVEVVVGLAADGYAEVTPRDADELAEGDDVVVGA